MKEVTARFLTQIIEEIGESANFRDDYSGRGMFGKETCAVDVDSVSHLVGALANFALSEFALNEEEKEALEELSEGLRQDSMGFGIVLY